MKDQIAPTQRKVSKPIQVSRKVEGSIDEGQRDMLLTAIEGTATEHAEQYAIADQSAKQPYKEIEEIRNEMEWSDTGDTLTAGGEVYNLTETSTITTIRVDHVEGVQEETTKIEVFYTLEMP